MTEPSFVNQLSWDFWVQCEGMPVGHLEIILAILRTLDAAASASSVRSGYPARGAYELQGRVKLLEHSINVATICRDLAGGMIIGNLSVIAGLGHDCGKLPDLHPGRYAAVMHAHWSAEYVRKVIGGRLVEAQADAVVTAIRYHHVAGDGAVQRVLREADGRAREEEMLTVVGRATRGG